MSSFNPAIATDLGCEPFLQKLLAQAFIPLNRETETDFIVSDGITLKLRRSDPRAAIINVTKLPIAANFVINHPSPAILEANGGAALHAILSQALASLRETRVRPVRDDEPSPGLIDLIMECLLYADTSETKGELRRLTVVAPSPVQKANVVISGSLGDPQRLAAIQTALEPLLTRIPEGGTRFEPIGRSHHHSHFRAEHDMHFILLPNTFSSSARAIAPSASVDRLTLLRKIHSQITELGESIQTADTIIETLGT